MTNAVHLPDAMPEIKEPSLFVICGSHECRMIGGGGKSLVEGEMIQSKEPNYTDSEVQGRGPNGMTSGTDNRNQHEDNRLREFANVITAAMETQIKTHGVKAIYLSAPSKMLSALKHHLPKAHEGMLKVVLDGTFVKEPALDILLRFRPDLAEAGDDLRDQENFSSKKHLPK